MTDEAVEMLYRIQERSPGSPLAELPPETHGRLLLQHLAVRPRARCLQHLRAILPTKPGCSAGSIGAAFASLAEFRGPLFDATPLIDARTQFKEIETQYPDLAADANVSGWIDRIDADLANKAYNTGRFYQRTNHLGGAVFMYRYVLGTYPNSHEAELAQRALAMMPPWALTGPPPPASNPEAAATQPIGGNVPGTSERSP